MPALPRRTILRCLASLTLGVLAGLLLSTGEQSRGLLPPASCPYGALPTVPPSTNSALVSVWRRSSFPRATLFAQRTMRRITGR